jgi:hypothetical protein
LSKAREVAICDEMAERKRILISVSRSKSLVSHIEESVVTTRLHGLANLLPLLRGWVDTSWIVRTCVKQENALLWGSLDILNQSLEIKSNCVLVVVPVLLNLQTRVLKNSGMVGPGWVGDIDFLCTRVKFGKESTTDPKSSGSRDGLCDSKVTQDG